MSVSERQRSEPWMIEPGTTVSLTDYDPDHTGCFRNEKAAADAMRADLERLRELQELLHVEGRHAVLLVLQGMDTSGKDGMIKHLSSGLSLVGAEVSDFKQPTAPELQHDFLWRIHQRVPERGRIGIFNRSQYEDVLVVRVHDLVPEKVWEKRYEQINAFEQMLTENGTTIVKCFLHISKKEQKERLLARLADSTKLWKFNPGDLKERGHWSAYQQAYAAALTRCNTAAAPWYMIPANKKWYRNYVVTRILVETLERLDMRYPTPDFDPADIKIR